MAEQGTHKPLVGGSNPPSATTSSALERLAGLLADGSDVDRLVPDESRLVLAVSGGPDSMALLAAAAVVGVRRRWTLTVAHLDHRLRPESAADADFVRSMAAERGLPFAGESVDVARLARERHRSLEETARDARYAFLERIARPLDALIVTAHTADDRAETTLLNVARGSGISGLRGIPVRRGSIVRPLLGVRRAALHAALAEAGVPYVTDASNGDVRYSRARIRHEVLPALARINPDVVSALLRLGRLASDDDELLAELAASELGVRTEPEAPGAGGHVTLDWHDPPRRTIGRRVIRLAAGAALPLERVEALLDAAEGARGGVHIELGGGRSATVRGRIIEVTRAAE